MIITENSTTIPDIAVFLRSATYSHFHRKKDLFIGSIPPDIKPLSNWEWGRDIPSPFISCSISSFANTPKISQNTNYYIKQIYHSQYTINYFHHYYHYNFISSLLHIYLPSYHHIFNFNFKYLPIYFIVTSFF